MRKLTFVAMVLCVMGCFGVIAQAQGPDVTVFSTNNIQLWGEVNDISAYSMSSTSCNRGFAIADWEPDTNAHPLIGQQMYRVDASGRMDMLGLSWLKHSFCALSQPDCANCQGGTGCEALGVGCADTYGTGLNGSQGNLGPRYDVNAATGAYNYPFPTQGEGGDAIFKRVQVQTSDINPALNAGARYFGEVIYITTDEQAWGTQFNNVTYHELQVTTQGANGGWNMEYIGQNFEEATCVEAWQAVVPSVVIQDVMVPGDGLLKLAYNVTDLGGGQWRYDYVVYNMNSDRSVQAVAIPVPAGVSTSNLYFNDVNYHSGEPFSGTDWTSTNSNGTLTWNTQTFAANENANAIRWSTAYTFSFVADSAPITANAALTLFKPGTPGVISVPVLAPESAVVTADFFAVPTTGGSPLVTSFVNTSSGNIDTFAWDFGDGQSSTEQSPTHIYLTEGVYTVTLTVSGAAGADTQVRTDYIDVGPAIHTVGLTPADAFSGATLTMPVTGGSSAFRQAFSLAVSYPTAQLTATDFTLGAAAAGAEFVLPQLDDTAGTMTLEVTMTDPPGGALILPAGFGQHLADLVFAVDGTFADGQTETIEFTSGVGAVPVDNVFVDQAGNLIPIAAAGADVTFFNQISFVRGNCDGLGNLNLIDALRVLNMIFAGATFPNCVKACDFDDSGTLNLLDGTGLLFFLFAGGSPPAAPFPAAGVDTTPDSLECNP